MDDFSRKDLQITTLGEGQTPPWDLLALADPSRKAVDDYLRRGECRVGRLEGEIVGEYVLLPTRPFTVELVNVAVAEDMQGRGYGRLLVEDAVRRATARGYRTIEVGTGNCGTKQLELYQKCGFTITHVDFDFFRRHYPEPIFDNGMECRHMVRLGMDLPRKREE